MEESRQRNLDWEGCYNVRDLGGLPTAAGVQTLWRSIIRADDLGQLTPRGRQALLDYGVRTIVDLRSPQEVAESPSAIAAFGDSAPAYLNIQLNRNRPDVTRLIRQAETRAEVYCLFLDHYTDAVVEILRAIAFAEPGGVVVHCQSGKDRTGTIVALILGLVRVPRPAIVADYAESQVQLWPIFEERIAAAGGVENLPFWLRPTATADMMESMLDHLDSRYGGVLGYVAAAGLTLGALARLRLRIYSPKPKPGDLVEIC
jgi:protein-tyrosine phosphatase